MDEKEMLARDLYGLLQAVARRYKKSYVEYVEINFHVDGSGHITITDSCHEETEVFRFDSASELVDKFL